MKELQICLENCDVIKIPWESVVNLSIYKVHKTYHFAKNMNLEMFVADDILLTLCKDANLPHREFGVFDETTVFKRLMKRRDIVALTIVYEDGKEISFHGPYDENERLIGNIATVRKGGKEVTYYVSYDEFECGFDNKFQTTELDDNGNLVIKIGDFNE